MEPNQPERQNESNREGETVSNNETTISSENQINRDQQPNNILAEEEKKASAESDSSNSSCKACGKVDTELSKCGGCGKVRYCSRDCQKNDWKNHKTECKFKGPSTEKIKEPAESEDKADLYDHLKIIGEGNFSQIFLARRRGGEEKYAMKVVNKQRVKMLRKENDLVMEKHCLIKMKDSEYVVDFIDGFENFLNIYIVMEYTPGGELWEIVKCFGLPSQSLVRYYFAHIVKAVSACHEKGIVHRDLKVYY